MTPEQREKLAELIRDTAGPLVKDMVENAWQEREAGAGAGAHVLQVLQAATEAKVDPGEKGLAIARMIGTFTAAKGDTDKALRLAKKRYGEESVVAKAFEKALQATDDEAGGFLVEEELSSEIIELLRPRSVVRALGARVVPNDSGTLRINRMTGGAVGGYIGESDNLPKEQQTFGQVVAQARKLGVLVPVSNDLTRRANRNADALIRDDLVSALAQKSDLAFIRNPGSSGTPKGLKFWAAAGNKFASHTAVPASVTLQGVTDDLGKAMQNLGDADIAFTTPGWIIEWRTWRFLITLRDGNGNLVFKPEMDTGTLFGFPYARTSQLPRNLDFSLQGDNDETEIYFADFAEVLIAETTQIMLDASADAAYFDGAVVQAAFSRDETVVRAIVEHDLVVRHDEAISVIEGVVYGAA